MTKSAQCFDDSLKHQFEKSARGSDRLDELVLCPDCNGGIEIDYTPEFNAQKPYERGGGGGVAIKPNARNDSR